MAIGDTCLRPGVDFKTFPEPREDLALAPGAGPQTIVLAGGCFWCPEGVFENTPGVIDVVSGYAGDSRETASYRIVCSGATNHAEVIRVTYDPAKTTLGKLLKIFFAIAHDPTTLDRQGADEGPQYRSAIFYASADQKRIAESYIRQMSETKVLTRRIVTKLEPLKEFFEAEDYHQDFVRNNPSHPYILQQAMPKVKKAKDAARG